MIDLRAMITTGDAAVKFQVAECVDGYARRKLL